MGEDQYHDWLEAAQSALSWWDAAGVDTLVDDTPRDWLAPVAHISPVSATQTMTRPSLPDTIEDFATWRTGADVPEHRWAVPILRPNLLPQPPLLAIVDMPDDDAAERPFGDAADRLFGRMLAAIGLDSANVPVAAIAQARPIGGQIPAEDLPALVGIMQHLIGVVRPKKVLILGEAIGRALIKANRTQIRTVLHAINLNGCDYTTVATYHPRFLLKRPHLKAETWRDLQLLDGGTVK